MTTIVPVSLATAPAGGSELAKARRPKEVDLYRNFVQAAGAPQGDEEAWRTHYNAVRPHSALGWRPPAPEVLIDGPTTWPAQATSDRMAQNAVIH